MRERSPNAEAGRELKKPICRAARGEQAAQGDQRGTGTRRRRPGLEIAQDWYHRRLQFTGGYVNFVIAIDEDIDFTADAKLWQVDSGFDGKAASGKNLPSFVSFQVVDVCSIAVCFLSDAVASAMHEVLTVSRSLDHPTCGIVNLESLQRLPFRESIFDELDRGISRGGDDLKDLVIFGRHGVADETNSSQIAVDGARLVEFGPKVNQHKVALAN